MVLQHLHCSAHQSGDPQPLRQGDAIDNEQDIPLHTMPCSEADQRIKTSS